MALTEHTAPAAFDETAERPVAYREHLRLDDLLPATRTDTDPYMALFLVPHQGCEVHFALMLTLISNARDALAAGEGQKAADMVRPLPALMSLVNGAFDVLSELPVEEFERIRVDMGTASGIQSAQWRAVEYACGRRDPRHLSTPGFTAAEQALLHQHLTAASLLDQYLAFAADPALVDSPAHASRVREIRTGLVAFGRAVAGWRHAHVDLAARLIGDRPGTAGTTGVDYLRAAAARPLFPGLTASRPEEGKT